jgi:hypothetical protein
MSAIKNGAALSQPAEARCVVDDALDRMRHAPPQLWRSDLIGRKISVERMRDILAFALAPLQAEVEAMRAEVERWKGQHMRDSAELRRLCQHRDEYKARAERLAEALRHQRWCRTCAEDGWESCEEGRKNDALLRDQEGGLGDEEN